MKRHSRFLLLHVFFFSPLSIFAISVTDNTDTCPGAPAANSLRAALLSATSGSVISLDFPAATTITLAGPLPAVVGDLTITSSTGSLVTIDGSVAGIPTYQPISVGNGTLTINANLRIQNGLSKGGDGGNAGATSRGGGAGGGGAGGGGGLYVHEGASLVLSNTSLTGNKAQGGAGGNITGTGGAGGGGGGFGSNAPGGNNSGKGGGPSGFSSGGGGGGHTAGGNGITANVGTSGGFASNTFGGGGAGGASNSSGSAFNGGAAFIPPGATSSYSGGSQSSSNFSGGGGAGLGGRGGNAQISPTNIGGVGGPGIGIDSGFGGGGGGAGGATLTAPNYGGDGTGAGGGGGSTNAAGGSGGTAGGGGGGGGVFLAGSTYIDIARNGGTGGFGAGGGGCFDSGSGSTAGTSLFGGGSGGQGTGAGGSGGGGAAMGGNLFIHTLASVTIGDNVQISSGQLQAGLAGTGGVVGTAGSPYGFDIFITSGATLTFTNSDTFTVTQNIQSNQGIVGLNPLVTTGGLIMNGTGTLNLAGSPGLVHTYTATTQINQGTVQISSDANLGSTGAPFINNPIVIQNGTLNTTTTFSSSRPFSLTGSNATINTNPATTLTLTGIISGSGSLNKQGTGTLILAPAAANTYTNGTTIGSGTLQIQADTALGRSTGSVTIGNGATLAVTVPATPGFINSTRNFILQGTSTISVTTLTPDVTPTTLVLGGSMSGSGQLVKTGNQTLFLLGTNSYSGGTVVNNGTLAGNTDGLQGNITINNPGILIFLQTAAGTYAGSLSGNGILQIGNTSTSPFPLVSFTGDSSSFTGPTQVLTSGVMAVNGSLANSPFTISSGGYLQGSGTTGPIDNFGTIRPGNSGAGTLAVNGNVTFEPGSTFVVEIDPTAASLLAATGSASLNGTLQMVTQTSGFYGLGHSYTILTAAAGRSGFFVFTSPPNFDATVEYFPTSVVLNVLVNQPFLNFPYDNPNERSVGENIDALVAAGDLTPDSPLGEAINALTGFPDSAINRALDQMHPAPFSSFAEVQAALGGQLISMFHRRPVPHCVCANGTHLWVEPYGNWLKEKNVGYQLGFNANSKGTAVGVDTEITEGWVVGIGFAWNKTHLHWRRGQGHASIQGYYAAAYTDYSSDNFYIGLSWMQGFDTCKSTRDINFSTIHEQAHATRRNRETIGQLATAVFFGPGACFAFPYLNIDYFFLKEGKVSESGAPGLNLEVRQHSGSTLRTEAGFAVQVQDINKNNTMCVSPLFGLGWAMEMPLNRTPYRSTFEGQPISFNVHGWDYTWQLFTLRFGFTITYKCASLYGGYVAEMSPLKETPFFDQRGDIRLEFSW